MTSEQHPLVTAIDQASSVPELEAFVTAPLACLAEAPMPDQSRARLVQVARDCHAATLHDLRRSVLAGAKSRLSPGDVRLLALDLSRGLSTLATSGAKPKFDLAALEDPRPLSDPDQLRDWAAAHGVDAHLGDSAAVLRKSAVTPACGTFLLLSGANYSLEDAFFGRFERQHLAAAWRGPRPKQGPEPEDLLSRELRACAARWLASVVVWIRLERDRDAQARALAEGRVGRDENVARFVQEILRGRQLAQAERAEPLPGRFHVAAHQFVPTLKCVVATVAVLSAGGWEPEVTTRVELDAWEAGRVTVRCGCTAESTEREGFILPKGCPHAALALRSVLAVAVDPSDDLAEWVRVPAWQRLIGAIDQHLSLAKNMAARAAETRLAWRVSASTYDGSVQLVPLVQTRKASGSFTSGKKSDALSLVLERIVDALSPREREAVELLAQQPAGWTPRGTVSRALLLLRGHPRVYADKGSEPLTIETASLRLEVTGSGEGFQLVCWLGDLELSPRALVTSAGSSPQLIHLHVPSSRCLVVELDPTALAVLSSIAVHGSHLPRHAADELVRRLPALQGHVDLVLPKELLGARVSAASGLTVRLVEVAPGVVDVSIRSAPLPGGPRLLPGRGVSRLVGSAGGRRVHALRDLAAERSALEALLASPGLAEAEPLDVADRRVTGEAGIVALLATLRAHPELQVEWEGEAYELSGTAGRKSLAVRVRGGGAWLGVSGALEVGGERVELARLVDAARRGRRWVAIGKRRFALLEEALLDPLREMTELLSTSGNELRLSPALAPLLEQALSQTDLEDDGAFSAALERARAARDLTVEPPAALASVLRPYQIEGFRWLARLATWGVGACLADDMGLGKTLQCLALLELRAALGPALVVAPTSLAFNWQAEAARFTPGLGVRVYRGPDRAKLLENLGPRDVLVTSYDILARDEEALGAIPIATLVLDEAQAVKNAATRRAKAARALRADFRLAMTGTPLENHLGELWSIFSVLEPGLLGGWEDFSRRFARPIELEGDRVRLEALSRIVRPFVLRRTKREVLPELPPRVEITRKIELSSGERELYETARLAALGRIAEGGEEGRIELLAALTRLRRLVCHPRLYDATSTLESSKLVALLELVEELRDEGRRALVFSQFTSFLEIVAGRLTAAGVSVLVLDGSTPAAERARRVEAFQAGEADAFLISLKAGGTGLNLTAADCVIHLDPWWNPAAEDQATDRAHRIGQKSTVTVVRLVAEGSIEESVLALHGDKRALAESLLDGADVGARLTNEDLIGLLERGYAEARAAPARPRRASKRA